MFVTCFAQDDLMCLFVDPIVAFSFFCLLTDEVGRNGIHDLVELDIVVRLTGNNQRSTRFVN